MSNGDLKKTREDKFGTLTVEFKEDGTATVTDHLGAVTHIYKRFPRTVEGLEQVLAFYDGVQEMTAQSELAMDAMMGKISIH